MSIALHIHCAASLVNLHIGIVGDIERSIQGYIHFVMSLLSGHFLTRRAVAPNEFILTVNRNELVDRNFCIKVTIVLAFDRHTTIISPIHQEFMRSPRPVART